MLTIFIGFLKKDAVAVARYVPELLRNVEIAKQRCFYDETVRC